MSFWESALCCREQPCAAKTQRPYVFLTNRPTFSSLCSNNYYGVEGWRFDTTGLLAMRLISGSSALQRVRCVLSTNSWTSREASECPIMSVIFALTPIFLWCASSVPYCAWYFGQIGRKWATVSGILQTSRKSSWRIEKDGGAVCSGPFSAETRDCVFLDKSQVFFPSLGKDDLERCPLRVTLILGISNVIIVVAQVLTYICKS